MAEITDTRAVTGARTIRTASGAKRRVNADGSAWEGAPLPPLEKVDKRRKPAVAGEVQRTFTVSLTMMRAIHSAFESALEAPRSADTVRILKEGKQWTTERLGPMVDPDYVPPLGKRSFVYRIRGLDGSVTDYRSAAHAAADYGVSEAGLKSMLSRSGGKCGRFCTGPDGEPARVECERLEVVLEPDEKNG